MPVPTPDPRRWWLVYDRPAVTLNRERNKHWSARAADTDEWRQAFWALAKQQKVPRFDRIEVTVHQEVHRGGPLPDIGACYPSVKAAVDGIVDAKVIPDDTGEHLVRLSFTPPTRSTRDALVLEICEAR